MSNTLTELRGQLHEARTSLASIFAEVDAGRDESGRQVYDLNRTSSLTGDSGARVEQIKAMNAKIDDLAEQVRAAEAQSDELAGIRQRVDELGVLNRPAAMHPTNGRPAAQPLSLGDAFVQSKAYKAFKDGKSINVGADLDVDMLATLFETGAGWAPESTRSGRVELMPTRPAPHVVDYFPRYSTSQVAIKYMEETTFTNNAVEKAEGAAYGEAALALTERSVDVEKIPVWLPVTDEQLEDVDGIRDYINNRLVFMLEQRLDLQALTGTGVAPLLLGTENVTGIQTQALGTDPIFDAALKLFTKIEDDGFAYPNVFFIRPSKWQTVALTRTADGLYILGNPAQETTPQLWGVPGVKTTAVTATKLVAGDYANFSGIHLKRGVEVKITDSHDTYFTSGKQAVRADVRVAVVHYRPKAFGNVTGL